MCNKIYLFCKKKIKKRETKEIIIKLRKCLNYKRKIKIKINNFVRKLTLCTCINDVPNVNICRCMRPHIYIHMYVCVCVLETVAMHWVLCASARILNQKLSSAIKRQNMRLFACHKQVNICMRVRLVRQTPRMHKMQVCCASKYFIQ